MIRELVRLRDRNQITLPAEIAERLSVEPGSMLELIMEPEGDFVEVRHAEVVRAGTAQAKREEQWARDDIRAGRFKRFADTRDFAADLARTRGEEQQERIEILEQTVHGLQRDLYRLSAARAGMGLESK